MTAFVRARKSPIAAGGCAACALVCAVAASAATWTRTSNGLPDKYVDTDGFEHGAVRGLAELDGVLHAGLERGGVYASTDDAANWSGTAAPAALLGCDVA